MRRTTTILVILLTFLAACASDPVVVEEVETPPAPLPTGPREIVLQVDVGVNQPDPFAIAGAYPPFTLYGDGLIVYRDTTAESGSLPPLRQARVSPLGMRRLMDAAEAVDVFGSPDTSRDETIADSDSIRIVANTALEQVALSIGDNADLHAFTKRLEQQWREIVGSEVVEEATPYDFATVLVLGSSEGGNRNADSSVALPVDLAVDGAEFATRVVPIQCAVMSADQFDTIRVEADRIDRPFGAIWPSGPRPWFVMFRPVLPHETDCTLVADQ